MIKRALLVVGASSIILGSGVSNAVWLTGSEAHPIVVIEVDGIQYPDKQYVHDFEERIGRILWDEGVEVAFAAASYTSPFPKNLSVHVQIIQDGPPHNYPFILISALKPESLGDSSFPYAQYATFATRFNYLELPDRDQLEIVYTGLVTAVSLYSVNRCDAAARYFETVLQAVDLIHRDQGGWGLPLAYDYINFYEGNCALMQGDYEKAISLYSVTAHETYLLTPYRFTLVNLAWALFQGGRRREAFAELDFLFDQGLAEATLFAWEKRTQLHVLEFDYDAAIADATQALDLCLKVSPFTFNCAAAYTLRGQMYLLLYEWDKVLADYNTAIELNPNYADAYFYRGVLFYTQGPRENALADFERYLELAPQGDHADEAAKHIESIRTELGALNH